MLRPHGARTPADRTPLSVGGVVLALMELSLGIRGFPYLSDPLEFSRLFLELRLLGLTPGLVQVPRAGGLLWRSYSYLRICGGACRSFPDDCCAGLPEPP